MHDQRNHTIDQYPYYWAGTGLWGAAAYPLAYGAPAAAAAATTAPVSATERELAQRADAERAAADPHLRSSAEVTDYPIAASDGSIGHIEDFLFDGSSWAIDKAVVDTRNWLPGKHVLVDPKSIESVDWNRREVRVRLTREAVKSSPPYDRDALLASG